MSPFCLSSPWHLKQCCSIKGVTNSLKFSAAVATEAPTNPIKNADGKPNCRCSRLNELIVDVARAGRKTVLLDAQTLEHGDKNIAQRHGAGLEDQILTGVIQTTTS